MWSEPKSQLGLCLAIGKVSGSVSAKHCCGMVDAGVVCSVFQIEWVCVAGSLVRKLVLERGVSFQPSIVELKLRGKDAQRAL